jgi:hypothetical protein
MTSIEWLIEEMLNKGFFKESVTLTNIDHLQYKAEEMHKQEIIDAYAFGHNDGCRYMTNEKQDFEHGEGFYQETFGSKGSSDHIVDINEMVEISDLEINDVADRLGISTIPMTYFIEGAKWYRQQLKTKI